MNCLAYALRFWEREPSYTMHYNSGHVINLPQGAIATGFLPADDFGYCYFSSAFKGLLDEYEEGLLKRYFKIEGVV